jgi:hypothetical protein
VTLQRIGGTVNMVESTSRTFDVGSLVKQSKRLGQDLVDYLILLTNMIQ